MATTLEEAQQALSHAVECVRMARAVVKASGAESATLAIDHALGQLNNAKGSIEFSIEERDE